MLSRKATPFRSRFSIGAVISCSTSSAERPSASVCTSTYGAENSGSASVSTPRVCHTPRATNPAAIVSTSRRTAIAVDISQEVIASSPSAAGDAFTDGAR